MRDKGVIMPVVAGLGVGIAVIVMFALNHITEPTTPELANVTNGIAGIIPQSEAETAARDDIDRRYQENGEQAGFYRGGKLGTAVLVYVDGDGTHYVIDPSNGTLGEKLRHSIDGSTPNQYIWEITLNYGDSSKPEYEYAVDAYGGDAWMIGVND